MGIIQSLIDESALVLYHDYRAGHMNDLSGNDNDGVPTDVIWQGNGVGFNETTSKITVADAAELRLTEGTIVALGEFRSSESWEIIVNKNNEYEIYLNVTPRVLCKDYNVTDRYGEVDVKGSKCLGVSFEDGELAKFYLNGVYADDGNDTNTFTTGSAAITIGGPTSLLRSVLHAILIVNRVLTATEHSQLYSELSKLTWPSQGTNKANGSYGVELMEDGDMEASGTSAYAQYVAGTYSKEAGNALSGSQVLRIAYLASANPGLYQEFEAGKRYRITGWARGDGTVYPRIYTVPNVGQTIWNGTTSTDWQYFDETFDMLTDDKIVLRMIGSSGWVEWDGVSVKEVYVDEVQFKTDWGAKVSSGLTAGMQIPGTAFMVDSGEFGVVIDTINGKEVKAIKCLTDGIFYLDTSIFNTPDQAAFGTWEWWINKGTYEAANIFIVAQNLTKTNSDYEIRWLTDETGALYERGIREMIGFTQDTPGEWTKFKVTRDSAYTFGLFINDVSQGTNFDITTTAGSYILFDLDADTMISLGTVTGDMGFKKYAGVV